MLDESFGVDARFFELAAKRQAHALLEAALDERPYFLDALFVLLFSARRTPLRVIGPVRLVRAVRIERVEIDEKRHVVMGLEPWQEPIDEDARSCCGSVLPEL